MLMVRPLQQLLTTTSMTDTWEELFTMEESLGTAIPLVEEYAQDHMPQTVMDVQIMLTSMMVIVDVLMDIMDMTVIPVIHIEHNIIPVFAMVPVTDTASALKLVIAMIVI
jgi:hypothetical protein